MDLGSPAVVLLGTAVWVWQVGTWVSSEGQVWSEKMPVAEVEAEAGVRVEVRVDSRAEAQPDELPI